MWAWARGLGARALAPSAGHTRAMRLLADRLDPPSAAQIRVAHAAQQGVRPRASRLGRRDAAGAEAGVEAPPLALTHGHGPGVVRDRVPEALARQQLVVGAVAWGGAGVCAGRAWWAQGWQRAAAGPPPAMYRHKLTQHPRGKVQNSESGRSSASDACVCRSDAGRVWPPTGAELDLCVRGVDDHRLDAPRACAAAQHARVNGVSMQVVMTTFGGGCGGRTPAAAGRPLLNHARPLAPRPLLPAPDPWPRTEAQVVLPHPAQPRRPGVCAVVKRVLGAQPQRAHKGRVVDAGLVASGKVRRGGQLEAEGLRASGA